MTSSALARRSLPHPVILGGIAAAWVFALGAQVAGRGGSLHHDALLEGGLPIWAALGLFLVAWQVMVAAMMLPSSLPLIALFEQAAAGQPNRGRVRVAFLAGYAAVWTTFGALAFIGDAALHQAVHRFAWLEANAHIIGGVVLVGAGVFQFSSLKDKCLDACRHPAAFILRHYGRGTRAAYALGRRHGLFCMGCCAALMVVSFAVGLSNLLWMAALAGVMVVEKALPRGDRMVAPFGIAFIVLGTLVLMDPAWLPSAVLMG